MSLKKKNRLNTLMLVLISTCIAINMVLGQLASLLKLPIFLDSIGTIIAALLGGPWIALLTGLFTNCLWGIMTSPNAILFAPVAMVIGLSAGFLARFGFFKQWWQVLLSGVFITLVLTLVATPIRTYFFGGVTGSGADFVVAYLHTLSQNLIKSVAWTIMGTNLIDKVVTVFIAWQIVRNLPKKMEHHFPVLAHAG